MVWEEGIDVVKVRWLNGGKENMRRDRYEVVGEVMVEGDEEGEGENDEREWDRNRGDGNG